MLLYVIYTQLFVNQSIAELIAELKITIPLGLWLLFMGVFSFLNVSIEALKWQKLVKKVSCISFVKSLKAIVAGNTLAMFTPNRTGEFGARVLFLEKNHRWEGVALSLLGSFSQILATSVVSGIAFVFFLKNIAHYPTKIWLSVWLIGSILALILLCIYYNIGAIKPYVYGTKWLKKIRPYILPLEKFSARELSQILGLSLLRYGVFSLQFILLLYSLGYQIPFATIWNMVGSVYFMQTVIPSIGLVELGVRGQVIMFVFAQYTQQLVPILAASLLMWCFNLMIPALIGWLMLWQKEQEE